VLAGSVVVRWRHGDACHLAVRVGFFGVVLISVVARDEDPRRGVERIVSLSLPVFNAPGSDWSRPGCG
jgi:hypothetical protein